MSSHTKPNNVTTPLTVAPGDPHWSKPEHNQHDVDQGYDYHDPVSLQQGGYTTGGALTMFGKVGFEPGQAVMNVDHGTIYDLILTRRYGTQGTYDFVISMDLNNSTGVVGDFRSSVEHGFDICKVDLDMTTLNTEVTAMNNGRFRVRMKDGEARKELKVIVPYRTAVRTFDAVELEKEFTYWVKEKAYSFAGYDEYELYKRIQPIHYKVMTDYDGVVADFTSSASKIQYYIRNSYTSSTPGWNSSYHGFPRWASEGHGFAMVSRMDFTDGMTYNAGSRQIYADPEKAYPFTSFMQHSLQLTEPWELADPLRGATKNGLAVQGVDLNPGDDGTQDYSRSIKKYSRAHMENARNALLTTGALVPKVAQHRTKYYVKTLPTPTSFVTPLVGLPGSAEWVDQFPVYDHDTLLYTVGNSYDTTIFARVYADVNPMLLHEDKGYTTSRPVDPTGEQLNYSWWQSMNYATAETSHKYYLTWFNSTLGIGYLKNKTHYGVYPNPPGNVNGGHYPDPDYDAKIANESVDEQTRIRKKIRTLVSELSGWEGSDDGQPRIQYEGNFYIAGSTPAGEMYDHVVGNTDATSFRSKKLDIHTANDSQIWDSDYTSYDQPTQGEVVFTRGRPDHIPLNDDSSNTMFNWTGVKLDSSIEQGVTTRYVSPPPDPMYIHTAVSNTQAQTLDMDRVELTDASEELISQHVDSVMNGDVPAGDWHAIFRRLPVSKRQGSTSRNGVIPQIKPDGKFYEGSNPGLQQGNWNSYSMTRGPGSQRETWYTRLLASEPAIGTWTQNDTSLSGVQGPGEDNTSHVLYDLNNLMHEQDTYKQNDDLKGYYKCCINHNNREIRLEISKYNESDPVELDLTTRSEIFINKTPIYEVLDHAQYDDTVRAEYKMTPALTMRAFKTWHDAPTEPSVVDQIFVPDGALPGSDVLFMSLEAGSLTGGSLPPSKQVKAAPEKAATLSIVSTANPSNAQTDMFNTAPQTYVRGNTYNVDTYLLRNTGDKSMTLLIPPAIGTDLIIGNSPYIPTFDGSGNETGGSGDKTDDWTVTVNNPNALSQAQANGIPMANTYILNAGDELEIQVVLSVTSLAGAYDVTIPVQIDKDGLLFSGGIRYSSVQIT